MKLLIINGQTSTGKTTLARRIIEDFAIDDFQKDAHWERQIDALGRIPTLREWVRYENETWQALYNAVREHSASGKPLLIEGNFARRQRKQLAGLVAGQQVFEVYCHADQRVILQRYMHRNKSGERHPGHRDHLWYPAVWWETVLGRMGRQLVPPLNLGGQILRVDTTDFSKIDYGAVRKFVRDMLEQ